MQLIGTHSVTIQVAMSVRCERLVVRKPRRLLACDTFDFDLKTRPLIRFASDTSLRAWHSPLSLSVLYFHHAFFLIIMDRAWLARFRLKYLRLHMYYQPPRHLMPANCLSSHSLEIPKLDALDLESLKIEAHEGNIFEEGAKHSRAACCGTASSQSRRTRTRAVVIQVRQAGDMRGKENTYAGLSRRPISRS